MNVGSILKRFIRNNEPLNILTFNTHERYQSQMAKTGHNFYAFNYDGGKRWIENHAPTPDNYYQLPDNTVYSGITFDLLLIQSKFGQYQLAQKINTKLKLPTVVLEHTYPLPFWTPEQLNGMRNMKGDVNVFITEDSREKWDIEGEVVLHGVDTEFFSPGGLPRENSILTVAHDFKNRDYALNYNGWERITDGLPRKVVGDTAGLSKPARSSEELRDIYRSHNVYINTTTLSPIPTSLLEAASSGCAIVTTATCEIPRVFEHGKNCLMSNDELELRKYCEELLADEDRARSLGENARKLVQEKFSEEKFVKEWNRVFQGALR